MMTWHDDRVLVWSWVGVAILLGLGAVCAGVFHRARQSPETARTLLRVRTWWLIAMCLFAATSCGRIGLAALFCAVSLVALYEVVTLDRESTNRRTALLVMGAGTVSVFGWEVCGALTRFLPAVTLIGAALLCASATITGSPGRTLARMGVFLLVTGGLACVVGLESLGAGGTTDVRGGRLVFLLLLLTGLNDVAQYLWGKSIGRRLVAPRISPRKTWAGLAGGVATTACVAAVLSGPLLGAAWRRGLFIGLLVGVGGFAGDMLASAYKRRVGAGESGWILPGHGGMMDRIDSLCVTAPLLYAVARYY